MLSGGFVDGSSYIVQGRPGSGKTILANQVVFAAARSGRKAIYATLLTESHDRLFQSLSTLDYYEAARVGSEVIYLSLFQVLRDEGLKAVVSTLRQEITRHRATLLVLDGLLNVRDRAESDLDVKTFIAELQGHSAFAGCTTMFLTSAKLDASGPEHTMVDGVLELNEDVFGMRAVRRLQVRKSRGIAALPGLHEYRICSSGIVVHPRMEAILHRPSRDPATPSRRLPSGIIGLDGLIGGGLPEASATLVMGPAGGGKTTFGLNFLGASTPEEPGIHFGFYEPESRLTRKAVAVGIDLPALQAAGALEVIWNPIGEHLLDELGHQLLGSVRRHGARRVFIDSLGAFARAAAHPPRVLEFFSALFNELRAQGVTTVATWEIREVAGPSIHSPAPDISTIVDNLFLLRVSELQSELLRVLAILKLRDGDFDPRIREVRIGPGGLAMRQPPPSAEGLVTGVARPAES